mmetsp:Transcript_5862/g.19717  ORF Transcript_5862/g.19717 Transcript_5862/m.19717 type:complete len:205 (-) Transcript_5862:856-1470(-)
MALTARDDEERRHRHRLPQLGEHHEDAQELPHQRAARSNQRHEPRLGVPLVAQALLVSVARKRDERKLGHLCLNVEAVHVFVGPEAEGELHELPSLPPELVRQGVRVHQSPAANGHSRHCPKCSEERRHVMVCVELGVDVVRINDPAVSEPSIRDVHRHSSAAVEQAHARRTRFSRGVEVPRHTSAVAQGQPRHHSPEDLVQHG